MTAIVSTDNPNELSGKLSGATRWGLTGSGFDDSGRRHKRAVESRLPAFAFEMPTEEEERIAFEADRILQQEDKDGDVEMKMGYRQDPFPEEEMEGSDDDDDMMDDMENDMDPRSQTF
jgi:hypothetical protein